MYANIVTATKLIVELLRESMLCGFNKPQKNIIYHRHSIFFHPWNSFSDSEVNVCLLRETYSVQISLRVWY